MKHKSIWSDIKENSICESLNKDIEVDILIIGGGITGISTLYHLKDSNLKVCLVEKNIIGSGVSSKTTGKLTYLQENIYSKLKSYHGIDKAKLYLESQKDAINIVKEIVNKENIECNLEKVKSFVFTNNLESNINEEINLLKDFNVDLKETDVLPDNTQVDKAYFVEDTYVFHPLKYLYSLKEKCIKDNISIFENTKIISINKENYTFICKTENNIVRAKNVIVASHYPYFFKKFFLPLKSHIEKSYIEAYKTEKDYKFSSINIDNPIISTRFYKDKYVYKIYLTNSHNTAIKDNDINNFTEVLKNKNNPDYIWSNKDIITLDMLPYIGSLNNENSFLIGTGYNTWGMTNGSLAGKLLSDIVLKKENKYIELFNPRRKLNKGKIINFPIALGSTAYSFIKSKVIKNKKWYSNRVKFEKRNGKNVAIYIDENNKEHIVYNICPHLKCSLLFNEIERTWDCPCHGSRFDIDGKSIEGPSNYDITYKG